MYTTKQTTEIVGVAESTLRNWIGDNYIPMDTYIEKHIRYFTSSDVKKLVRFKKYIDLQVRRTTAAKWALNEGQAFKDIQKIELEFLL